MRSLDEFSSVNGEPERVRESERDRPADRQQYNVRNSQKDTVGLLPDTH